ncbi:MAG: hypothetical protein H6Q17_1564 [Bacteroidetes bacterium]|nr:hypothetical protein [Bacteroidota bacterium]
MKRCIALLSFALFVLVSAQLCDAQSFENQSASIAAAFNARNATSLSVYFCNSVELVLPGVDNTYPKAQARNHVAEFFGKQQTKSFEVLHQGSRATVSFIVGQLTTITSSFRVNMLFKKEGNILKIYQLRIE